MSARRFFLTAFAAITPLSLSAQDALPAGIWTNTEDEYFAEEEGRETPEWIAIRVGEDGKWERIDPFGEPLGERSDAPIPELARREDGGWQIGGSELRRAREFTCWISVRKFAGKPDGSADWTFQNNLSAFDQGGRIFVDGNGEAPDVTFRMRNVTWAKGSRNAPSLVLYVHKDDPVRAESYSWAGPGSKRVGINLRWVQGSCAQDYEAQGATEDALVAAGERWRALYEAGDWDALRQLYTDDAVLMTQGEDKIEGADNIVTFLQRVSKAGGTARFRFEPEEVVAAPPFGHVTATYRMDISFPGRAPVAVAGRSYLVYKWQDGEWKLWRDIDNLAPDVTPEGFAE
ncbi:MAG: DUF4440 domain-containing protein [Pseudomonadota bacterium]